MAFLHFPKRWVSQPQYPVAVDWAHPLASRLICAFDFRGPIVTQRMLRRPEFFGHAIATKGGRSGLGLDFNGSSDSVSLSASSGMYFFDQNAITFVVASRPDSVTSTTMLATNDSSGFGGAQFRFNGGGLSLVKGGVSEIMNLAGAVAANEECVVAVTYDGTNAAGFKTGRKLGTASNAQTFVSAQSLIGQRGNGTEFFDGTIFGIWAFSGNRPDEEVIELTKNPWQLYVPLPRRVYVTAGAAAAAARSQVFWG